MLHQPEKLYYLLLKSIASPKIFWMSQQVASSLGDAEGQCARKADHVVPVQKLTDRRPEKSQCFSWNSTKKNGKKLVFE